MKRSKKTANRIQFYLFLLLICMLITLAVVGCQTVDSPFSEPSNNNGGQLLTAIARGPTAVGTAQSDASNEEVALETSAFYEYSSPTVPPEVVIESTELPVPTVVSTTAPEPKEAPSNPTALTIVPTAMPAPTDMPAPTVMPTDTPRPIDTPTNTPVPEDEPPEEDPPSSDPASFSMAGSSESSPSDVLNEISAWIVSFGPSTIPDDYKLVEYNNQIFLREFEPFERVRVFAYQIYGDELIDTADSDLIKYHPARIISWGEYYVDEVGRLTIYLDSPREWLQEFVALGDQSGEVFEYQSLLQDSIFASAPGNSGTAPNLGDNLADPNLGDILADPNLGDNLADPNLGDILVNPNLGDNLVAPSPGDSTPASAPEIRNFQYCLEPCNGSNSVAEVPGGTQRIYLHWTYHNIPVGSLLARVWRTHLGEWVRYECIWPGPESGTTDISLREPGGLLSAPWNISINVDGQNLLDETVNITGNWQYWAPAGRINRCF